MVVGGGDVAVDVARSALRLGARKVRMAVRGSSGRMPACEHQQKAAREEGVEIEIGLSFLRVTDDGAGHVAGLECERGNSRRGAGLERLRAEAGNVKSQVVLLLRDFDGHGAAGRPSELPAAGAVRPGQFERAHFSHARNRCQDDWAGRLRSGRLHHRHRVRCGSDRQRSQKRRSHSPLSARRHRGGGGEPGAPCRRNASGRSRP